MELLDQLINWQKQAIITIEKGNKKDSCTLISILCSALQLNFEPIPAYP
jgi:DNA-binding XRE family transcriptional regulator